MLPELASAQVAAGSGGGDSVKAVADAIESNYGLLVGLGVAALGMWMWLMDQNNWGVVMMVGGVAITAFPGLFGGLYDGVSGFFEGAGAGNRAEGDTITQ